MSSGLKIGVIGVGKMGTLHLQKYLQNPDVAVSGIYDSNPETCTKFQTVGVKVYTNLDELLFDSDAVSIATPTDTHFATTKRALENGVHVLIEKPISHHVEEAEKLVRLAKEKDLIIQVGFVERFRYRTLTQSFSPAKVLFIEGDRLAPCPGRESEIDVVSDLMIHDLDLVLALIPEEPSHVSAVGLPIITRLSDVANARLEFPGGAVVNLTASRVSDKPMRKFRVFSSNSYASIDFINNTVDVAQRDSRRAIAHLTMGYSDLDALRDQCLQFIQCVQRREKPLVSGEDGLRALRVAQAIKDRIAERIRLSTRPEAQFQKTL
jgi:predicted dehydrogenase